MSRKKEDDVSAALSKDAQEVRESGVEDVCKEESDAKGVEESATGPLSERSEEERSEAVRRVIIREMRLDERPIYRRRGPRHASCETVELARELRKIGENIKAADAGDADALKKMRNSVAKILVMKLMPVRDLARLLRRSVAEVKELAEIEER